MSKKYSKIYQQTHDIDWFCKIGNTPMHFASNCGLLPDKVNNRDVNRGIQEQVAMMENVVESNEHVVINRDYVRARLGDNFAEGGFEDYVRTFVEMAMKGFVSFDRSLEDDDVYIWIAKPDAPTEVAVDNMPKYLEDACWKYYHEKEIVHVRCLNKV